jgi:hypothetical protein
MSYEEEFLLVLVLIYFTECWCLVRKGAVAIRSWAAGRFGVSFPSTYLGNESVGLIALDPLPLGRIFLCNRLPFSISPNGIYSYVSQSSSPDERSDQHARYVKYVDIRTVTRDGKTILVNEERFVVVEGEAYADYLCGLIGFLVRATEENRHRIVCDEISRSLDVNEIGDILKIFYRRCLGLRCWSVSVFITLFVLLPWLTLTYRLAWLWPVLAITLLLQMIVVGSIFAKLHRLYYPTLTLERRVRLFTMLLVPPALIRSVDYISLGLLANHHPLAVACVLCDRNTFIRFARFLLLDLRFPRLPICPSDSCVEVETERWYRETLREQVETFLGRRGFDLSEIVGPPRRDGVECLSYCPRCDQQFVLREGVCVTCGGILLMPFETRETDDRCPVGSS